MTNEEKRVLQGRLENQLKKILTVTHAEVDAEYIRMAAEISRVWKRSSDSMPQFHQRKKRVEVELNLNAVDIILALGRIVDGTYGICLSCGSGLPYELLDSIPTEVLCSRCRTSVKAVSHN